MQRDEVTREGGSGTQRLNGVFNEKRALRESGLVWAQCKNNMEPEKSKFHVFELSTLLNGIQPVVLCHPKMTLVIK